MQHTHSHTRSPAGYGRDTEAYMQLVHGHLVRYPSASLYCQQLLNFLSGPSTVPVQKLRTVDISEVSVQDPEHPIWSEADLHAPQKHPRITIVAGFPSPANLAEVGVYYDVRPELFITHLETNIRNEYLVDPARANSVQTPMSFFELPQLPSSLTSVVNVRLVTLCRARDDRQPAIPTPEERQAIEQSAHKYQDSQFQAEKYGSTRFRKVHMHNRQYFSVEQMVSFWVTQPKGQPWRGLFLLDKGRTLEGQYDLPWSTYGNNGRRPSIVPSVSFSTRTGPNRATSGGEKQPSADQLHPYDTLNDLYASDTEELQLLRETPFFLLSRLLFTAAQSWAQFLNHLSRDINYCIEGLDAKPGELYLALGQLRYNASLLARVEGFLNDDKRLIEQQGSKLWPRSSSKSSSRIHEIQGTLNADYDFLLKNCAQLSTKCERFQDTLVSAAQTLDAQKSVEQARRGHQLTRLAFIFVPLAFVASLFGMNVDILDGNPPWWYYLIISIPLTFLSWIMSDWQELGLGETLSLCQQHVTRWFVS